MWHIERLILIITNYSEFRISLLIHLLLILGNVEDIAQVGATREKESALVSVFQSISLNQVFQVDWITEWFLFVCLFVSELEIF